MPIDRVVPYNVIIYLYRTGNIKYEDKENLKM